MAFIDIQARESPIETTEAIVDAYNREATPLLGRLRTEINKIAGDFATTDISTDIVLRYRYMLVDDGVVATVTLPFVADAEGQKFLVKKVGNSGDVVTVAAQLGQTIDGAASVALSTTYGWLEVLSDGTEWLKVAEG